MKTLIALISISFFGLVLPNPILVNKGPNDCTPTDSFVEIVNFNNTFGGAIAVDYLAALGTNYTQDILDSMTIDEAAAQLSENYAQNLGVSAETNYDWSNADPIVFQEIQATFHVSKMPQQHLKFD